MRAVEGEDEDGLSEYLIIPQSKPRLLKIIGLDRAPGRETIRTALLKPPESYLKRLNDLLVEPFKKGV
jgi:hypothetical protein